MVFSCLVWFGYLDTLFIVSVGFVMFGCSDFGFRCLGYTMVINLLCAFV